MNVEFCSLDGARLGSIDTDSMVGRTVGRYEIESIIGDGGMARVYKARHTFLNKPCAVKVLYGDLASEDLQRKRFQREGYAGGVVDHPNVVDVTDFGHTDSGLPFLVMEFVDGVTLTDVLRERSQPDREWVAEITRQIAMGLGGAHDKGLVHRDLKPSNIMIIDPYGDPVVKIVDFGVAQVMREDGSPGTRLTKTGYVLGTPWYMAPEQITGEGVTPQSDLYALGAILYSMLAGRAPFEGDMSAVLSMHISTAPEPIEGASDLGRLALDLLEKRAEKRPKNSAAVVARLDRFLGHPTQDSLRSDPHIELALPSEPAFATTARTKLAAGPRRGSSAIDADSIVQDAVDSPSASDDWIGDAPDDSEADLRYDSMQVDAPRRDRSFVAIVVLVAIVTFGAVVYSGKLMSDDEIATPDAGGYEWDPAVEAARQRELQDKLTDTPDAGVIAPRERLRPPSTGSKRPVTTRPTPTPTQPKPTPTKPSQPSEPTAPPVLVLDDDLDRAIGALTPTANATPDAGTATESEFDRVEFHVRLGKLNQHDATPSRRSFDDSLADANDQKDAAIKALDAGDVATGERMLRQCLEHKPTHPHCHKLLGLVLHFTGNHRGAREHYDRYTTLAAGAPDVPMIKSALAELR